MHTRTPLLFLLIAVLAIALAACGDDKEKKSAASTQTAPATTPASPGAREEIATTATVLGCVPVRGKALGLKTEFSSSDLTLEGVDAEKYQTVAVNDGDGGLVAQVLIFRTKEEAAAGLEQIEKNGFFDDVRPGGNALTVIRGADEETAKAIQSCLPAAG